MEGLSPGLNLLLRCRRAVDQGKPLSLAIKSFLQNETGEFPQQVFKWMSLFEQGQKTDPILNQIKSSYRRQLLEVLERGLKREPIGNILVLLETEIHEACEEEIQKKLTDLPYQVMLPLLLFQFPAFLLLLLGPFLLQLIENMN
ncbi:MAG: hypothetical protein AABY64_09875 [Bdellovibrionota bacterium]